MGTLCLESIRKRKKIYLHISPHQNVTQNKIFPDEIIISLKNSAINWMWIPVRSGVLKCNRSLNKLKKQVAFINTNNNPLESVKQ